MASGPDRRGRGTPSGLPLLEPYQRTTPITTAPALSRPGEGRRGCREAARGFLPVSELPDRCVARSPVWWDAGRIHEPRGLGMGMEYDVIVVGARCGGSPAAMLLARSGYRVLLVDKATFPSDTMSTH